MLDGESADLSAKVTGTEPITIKWSKNGKLIENSDVYKITFARNVATLKFTEVFPEDAGSYTCEAKNQHGMASSTASLTVKGKPLYQLINSLPDN